tara:strand:+ start:2372 stop:3652 length:1281 start_codon:yes stop_codon:yes gene_type:complete
MIKDKNLMSYLFHIVFILTVLILLFGRSFVGIYLFNLRLGEYLVASSLLLTLVVFFCYFFYSDSFRKIMNIVRVHFAIVVTFLLITFLTNSSLLNSYTYKSSSYIWTLGFLYVGYYIFSYVELNTIHLNVLFFVSLLVYLNSVTVTYVPDLLLDFFTNNSDKLESLKGADLVMVFVIATFFSLKKLPYKRLTIDIFIFLSALYLPLVMWKSKGAFLGFIVYVLFQLLNNKEYLRKSLSRNIVIAFISIILFFLSSLAVVRGSDLDYGYEEIIPVVANRKVANNDWLFLYIEDGRIYSYDGNANWRLQIWQDVIEDSISDRTYFYGVGYKEIIPAMDDPKRQGWDGKNENVHNFLVNNYARGGLVHLFLFLYLYWIFLYKYKEKDKSILIYTLPFFITSLFDASMENAHFPVIFYFFLGSLFSESLD